MQTRLLKTLLLALLPTLWLAVGRTSAMFDAPSFAPSNARTADGKLIPVEQFFPAARCAACHQDTHSSWSNSLHRNAAREPFYRESADILLKTRGIELTRHCESCHTPVALFSGALTKTAPKQTAPFTPLDDEGISCSVCHSITEARLDGTGSYTIRRPALLAQPDGTPRFGDFTDDEILADIPGHKRAVMRPLLKSPEFCATCHKVDAPPALNGYKHIRGFSTYDEWQQSGASHESVLPFYRRDQRTDCRACHMPKIESHNDRSAKDNKIASHRWLGANTAAPLFYGQQEQVALTTAFLAAEVAEIDIFALRKAATNQLLAPLSPAFASHTALNPGEEVIAEVVVSNRNAAHSFPPEVRDLYEPWVEFQVTDANGKTLYHSGYLKPDGMLDESAHIYKTIILDESGRTITRHQIWTTTIKAYDNTIPPGRSDVVRYRFRVPAGTKAGVPLTLRAKLNYRRFNQEYTNYIQQQQKKPITAPVVQMAEVALQFGAAKQTRTKRSVDPCPEWKRWNDYGIGLLEQSQYGEAAVAFHKASELNPIDADLLVNAALAELRTERYAHHERPQLEKAAALIERALSLPNATLQTSPSIARARFYQSLIWRAQGKRKEAAEVLQQLANAYPRDREVQRQLAQTRYNLGELLAAQFGFEAILKIDPTDFGAYQFLYPLYASAGRNADAQRANELYLLWRDDPRADDIAAKFYAAHPEWAEERIGNHLHGQGAPPRPVLLGPQATPVQ